jgi:protein-S-isoprenylcysteine O-methyltransferase Ste14
MANIALLLGLFAVPTLLLALGHRLRERSPRQRGAFWGGVIGHSVAALVAVVAMHAPPVLWTGDARVALVFGAMLAGGVIGAAAGAMRAAAKAS